MFVFSCSLVCVGHGPQFRSCVLKLEFADEGSSQILCLSTFKVNFEIVYFYLMKCLALDLTSDFSIEVLNNHLRV